MSAGDWPLQPHDTAAVVRTFLQQYAVNKLQNAPLKQDLLHRILKEAEINEANAYSNQLFQWVTNDSLPIPIDYGGEPASPSADLLVKMKDVDAPTRFGDVVGLPRDAELIVIGDTHGDLASVQKIIRHIEEAHSIENGAFVVFLGDYVNNGVKSWRTLLEILTFQQRHPKSVILLSGNHEFKESFGTALDEYFFVHWDHFTVEELPKKLADRLPQNDNHYGHMRLDLIRSFGFEEGERLYDACAHWGVRLPYICLSGDLMLSHSIGKPAARPISSTEVLNGKAMDAEMLVTLEYEGWRELSSSLHSAMVNNRKITADLLDVFSQHLDVDKFVVGHCHYRSGDTKRLGKNTVTTVVSSSPYSPDSGHYMYQQMVVERAKKREVESLTAGDASACILRFSTSENGRRSAQSIALSSLHSSDSNASLNAS